MHLDSSSDACRRWMDGHCSVEQEQATYISSVPKALVLHDAVKSGNARVFQTGA